MRVTLAGHCCESGDLIGENLPGIAPLEKGDIVAVVRSPALIITRWPLIITGCRTSGHNGKGRPDRVIVRSETREDSGSDGRINIKREKRRKFGAFPMSVD